MRFFIANTSQQNQMVNYRLPESTKPMTQTIPIGSQMMIGGADLTSAQVDAIVSQLRPYGLIGLSDLGRTVGVVPYVYSEDNPVSSAFIRKVIEHNWEVKANAGKKMRLEAAIATNAAVDAMAERADLEPVKALEMSVEEIDHGDMPDGEKPLAEGFRMERPATRPRRKRA